MSTDQSFAAINLILFCFLSRPCSLHSFGYNFLFYFV